MIRKTYRVYRQLSELYRDHDVYISDDESLAFNDFVRIRLAGEKKSIFVWVRFIDGYYKTFYNSVSTARFSDPRLLIDDEFPAIVLCRHYRVKLGLPEDTPGNVELEIRKIRNPMYKIRALYNAPDSLVRTTTMVSVISLLLGLVGLILGIISLL